LTATAQALGRAVAAKPSPSLVFDRAFYCPPSGRTVK
jgi:hypothetical protein